MRGSNDQTTKRNRKMKRQRKKKVKRPKNQTGNAKEVWELATGAAVPSTSTPRMSGAFCV